MKPIFLWRTLPLRDRANLPSKPGLYAVKSLGRVMYVGKSVNLKRRWQGSGHHRYDQACNLVFPHLAYITMPERAIHTAEARLIDRLNTPWNDTPVPSGRFWVYVRMFLICAVMPFVVERYWGDVVSFVRLVFGGF